MGRGVDDALLVALVQDADGAPYPVEVLETARRDLGSTQSAGDARRQNERVANAFDDVIAGAKETRRFFRFRRTSIPTPDAGSTGAADRFEFV